MMKHLIQRGVAAATLGTMLSVGAVASTGERVGDFALLDQDGHFHHMGWYGNNDANKAIVLLSQVNKAASTHQALADFSNLRNEYEDQDVTFFLINPLGQERENVRREMAGLDVDIPVLIDEVQSISRDLGIEHAGQAVVYDPRSFEVLYRGPAGEPLADAVAAVVEDREITRPEVAMTEGTPVRYYYRGRTDVSYSEDVAPILAENCARCHREGGIGPFAMDSHTMAQGWAPMIREVLMTKRMPPGQIDPHVGEFENTYTLDVEDERKILAWVDAGAPKQADEPDPLAELTWPETDWAFGEPDMILDVPPQEIPATGVLDYIHTAVPIPLEEDRWLKASQYVAGDRTVLHHTLNAVVGPDEQLDGSAFIDGKDPNKARIQAYIPGAQPEMAEPNTGGLLEAGSTLALQLHYTTNGRETVDESRIGLWFYDKDNTPEERMMQVCACIFTPNWENIPPYDPNFVQSTSITLDRDAYLYSFLPHMHFRGKWMRFEAHYPDGSVEELINIASYNYNWQMDYQLKDPKFVPAGTEVVATGAFDNSEQNLNNPDPSRSVPWGQQSWDEMFFGAFSWKWADQSVHRVTGD
ncbi:MAG: hypothetical protein ACQETO_08165 [Pseudomonadota bacterium]